MSFAETNLQSLGWRKARRCMANGNCVEVGQTDDVIAVRDSTNTGGYVLVYGIESWRAFTCEARQGKFGKSK
jgi:Domain of unknown function (DUF397)